MSGSAGVQLCVLGSCSHPWPSTMRSVLLVLILVLAPAFAGAHADEDSQDRALDAVRRGEILPLSVILDRLREADGGQVLEVELENEHDRWIYEVTTLAPNGVVSKRLLDASTGLLLPPNEDD